MLTSLTAEAWARQRERLQQQGADLERLLREDVLGREPVRSRRLGYERLEQHRRAPGAGRQVVEHRDQSRQ